MVLLLTEVQLVELGVCNNSNDRTVLLYACQLHLQVLGVLGVLLLVLREGLLLGVQPIFVESSQCVLTELVGPYGGQCAQSSRSLDVTHDTYNHEGWCLDDGHSLDGLLLVQLGAGSIHFTKDVRHTGLETGEGGQVHGLLGVIGGVRLYPASVLPYSSSGDEPKMSMSGGFEFSVRHFI